jgi:hexokinase
LTSHPHFFIFVADETGIEDYRDHIDTKIARRASGIAAALLAILRKLRNQAREP